MESLVATSSPSPRARVQLRENHVYWALLVVLFGAFLARERWLGLTFPSPWPDEALFLWQALGFRDHGSPFAPELHETRPVFWMPYGYMALSGLIFKVTGFSLAWARSLSALYLCGTLACFAYLGRAFRARFVHIALFAILLSSPICALAGNTARMETLVTLDAAAGLLLLSRSRLLAGLAVLSLGPLIHPNGQFAVLAGCFFLAGKGLGRLATVSLTRQKFALEIAAPNRGSFGFELARWELVCVGVACAAWLAFIGYFSLHSQSFVTDLAGQLDWKRHEADLNFAPLRKLGLAQNWLPMALLVGLTLPSARFAPRLLPFMAFAAAFMIRNLITTGWTYEYYTALAYACVAVCVVETATCALAEALHAPRARTALIGGLSALVGAAFYLVVQRAEALKGSVEIATVEKAEPRASSAYWDKLDHELLREYFKTLERSEGGPWNVFFSPTTDALLFEDLRTPRLRFVHGTPSDPRMGDVFVLHYSASQSKVVREMSMMNMWLRGAIGPAEDWPVLHSRPGNRWAVYRRKAELPNK